MTISSLNKRNAVRLSTTVNHTHQTIDEKVFWRLLFLKNYQKLDSEYYYTYRLTSGFDCIATHELILEVKKY